jgi:hypothetical protein
MDRKKYPPKRLFVIARGVIELVILTKKSPFKYISKHILKETLERTVCI